MPSRLYFPAHARSIPSRSCLECSLASQGSQPFISWHLCDTVISGQSHTRRALSSASSESSTSRGDIKSYNPVGRRRRLGGSVPPRIKANTRCTRIAAAGPDSTVHELKVRACLAPCGRHRLTRVTPAGDTRQVATRVVNLCQTWLHGRLERSQDADAHPAGVLCNVYRVQAALRRCNARPRQSQRRADSIAKW